MNDKIKKKLKAKPRPNRSRIPAATTYKELESSSSSNSHPHNNPASHTNNLSFMIQSPSRDRDAPGYYPQHKDENVFFSVQPSKNKKISNRIVSSPLILSSEVKTFQYHDKVKCLRGQLQDHWLSLGRTTNLEERWKLQSQLAGPHSQSIYTLDLSNRLIGSLEALEYGVPPQMANRITTLKYPALDCPLPKFLSLVSQLFPRLEHLHLATATAPLTASIQGKEFEGDGEVMAADDYVSDGDDFTHSELLDQPTLRLYIIFRLPDLKSFNDIFITSEERELARPSCPSGPKVDKNNWYSVSKNPPDDDNSIDDDVDTVIHSNSSSMRSLDFLPSPPTACPTTPTNYHKTPPNHKTPSPPSLETEEVLLVSPSSANQMYSPSRRTRHVPQPIEERSPTSPPKQDPPIPWISDEHRHPPQQSIMKPDGAFYLQPRMRNKTKLQQRSLSSPFPMNFRPSRTPNTRPPPSPASTPRMMSRTPRTGINKIRRSDRVTSIPQTTTSMLDNLEEEDDDDDEDEDDNIISEN